MKMAYILIMLMMQIPIGMASSQNITPDDVIIITGNTTASDPIADSRTSNFNDPATYTFVKDIGNAKGVEVIMVHFKNAFRGANQNSATLDQIRQVSDRNYSQVIVNSSRKMSITIGTPLKLEDMSWPSSLST
jgi:hypothetical protein